MSKTVSFVTTTRRHLADMTRILVGGIGDEFMRSAENPVVISVRGTFRNGKKVIPDTAIQKIFKIKNAQDKLLYVPSAAFAGRYPVYTGNAGCDEYWLGRHNGKLMEITFINADLSGDYFSQPGILKDAKGVRSYQNSAVRAQNFLKIRKHGGITFVHNCDFLAENGAWLDIWLESEFMIVGYDSHKLPQAHEFLREIFAGAAKREWGRFVQVEIRQPELLESPQFGKALDRLKAHEPLFGQRLTKNL